MIKIVIGGVEIQCETAAEAVQIAQQLQAGEAGGNAGQQSGSQGAGAGLSRWTVDRFRNLTANLQDKQRKLLRELVSSPDGKTDSAIRQSLGLASNKAFGPILTGMSRRAKKVGMSLSDIMVSEKVTLAQGDQILEFKATPAFIRVANEAGGVK